MQRLGVVGAAWSGTLSLWSMAASLLPISGVFQVFDGAQVDCVGALHGLGAVAILLLLRVRSRLERGVARVRVDEAVG